MYRESKRQFLYRLKQEYNIYPNDISDIIDRLSDGDSTENICEEYKIDEVDLERIINQIEYNESDEIVYDAIRDDI